MARNSLTEYYEIDVDLKIVARNLYHDVIDSGGVRYSGKARVKDLKEMGELLARLQEALDG